MPQAKQTKNYYTFVEGLNTEVSPLVYPDNTAADLSNLFLNVDGSISRRKGLTPETGATFKVPYTGYTDGTDAITTHFWRNAAGSDTHFHIIQVGYHLYFYEDGSTTLATREDGVDLRTYLVETSSATDADIAAEPVDISWGRGQALVSHPFLKSFYLDYSTTTDDIEANEITLKIRDFVGVEDGLSPDVTPSTLTDEHKYNLLNAGWNETDIAAFQSGQGYYPSNNMTHWKGYKRTYGTNISEVDGTRSWDDAKLVAEGWPNAPAKRGKFLVSPFANQFSGESGLAISTWTITNPEIGGNQTVTITTDGNHNLSNGDTVEISNNKAKARFESFPFVGEGTTYLTVLSLDGQYVISNVTATTFEFTYNFPLGFYGWTDQYYILGTMLATITGTGELTVVRPTTNAFFAGRAWYAGTPAGTLGQSILFSQIIQKDSQYERCYQEADPTSEFVSDLVESDGGILYIPEAGRVTKLMPFGSSMLVMCVNGIWEIGGGGNRYFDALDYTVNQISEVGCVSKESVVRAAELVVFASDQGAYAVAVDPQTRGLVVQSLTEEKVNTKWQNIHPLHKQAMRTLWDPVDKRIMFMYDTSSSPTARTWNYREVLIFDLRLNAWYRLNFPASTEFTTATTIKAFVTPDIFTRNGEAIIKYLTYTTGSGFRWNEMTESAFSDLGEVDAAGYILTGFEHMGDASRDLQAQYITTFMEREEDSSLKMTVRWDFSESSVTGKESAQVECYRPPRAFLGTVAEDGYPVVFAKHNVPGQGVVAQVKFETTPAKPAKLYGWTVAWLGTQ